MSMQLGMVAWQAASWIEEGMAWRMGPYVCVYIYICMYVYKTMWMTTLLHGFLAPADLRRSQAILCSWWVMRIASPWSVTSESRMPGEPWRPT